MRSSRFWQVGVGVLALLALLALANGVRAGEYGCAACQDKGGWDPLEKLEEIGNLSAQTHSGTDSGMNTAQKNRVDIWKKPIAGFESDEDTTAVKEATGSKTAVEEVVTSKSEPEKNDAPAVRSDRSKKMLVQIDEISGSDVLLDISEKSENATEHIPGSIAIPYTDFLRNNTLKSVEEITDILGGAGISESDPLVIYGECMPCGGGPAPAAYVYMMLKSLGHENVRVLDATVEDWAEAGKPTSREAAVKSLQKYNPQLTPDLMAAYDYVKSGSAQILDARTMQEFGAGSIPGAINIPYESVLDGKKIKGEARLERIFSTLSKDRPVVVYTNTGLKAAVVWFSLELLGYDARLYSYENWLANQAAEEDSAA